MLTLNCLSKPLITYSTTFNLQRFLSTLPPTQHKKRYKNALNLAEITKIHHENLNPCLKYLYKNPPILVEGKMQYVWDEKGRRYLDLFGGIVTTSVGHCHPRLVEVVKGQADKLWHTSSLYIYEEIYTYAARLVEKFPNPLKNVFFCNSGSEANEFAILLARLHTQRYDIIGLRNCYHGCSPNTLSLLSIGAWRFPIPQAPGFQHAPCPDPYRGRFGGAKCRDSLIQPNRTCDCPENTCNACDVYLEDLNEILNSTICQANFAGFIAESIQGVGGFVQYPKNYIKKAYECVKNRGGLFIIDEVQTGFGRLGSHFWGFESHDIIPDIVTMAKGIGNGFPMAAVVTSREIASSIKKASFFNTFGGNPLACRIGDEVLNIISDEKMQQNSDKLGKKMILGLGKLREKYGNIIGDVRGKGLMIAIDLIANEKTRQPISSEGFAQIIESLKNENILIGKGGPYGTVLRITPPMCVREEDIDYCLTVFEKVFSDYQKSL